MKIAFRKGYDKGDIRNFLANSNEDIDKFLKTLPQKFYKPVINSKMFDSSEIIPDPKDFNPKRKSLFIFDDIMTEKNQDPASNFTQEVVTIIVHVFIFLKIIISYLVKQ